MNLVYPIADLHTKFAVCISYHYWDIMLMRICADSDRRTIQHIFSIILSPINFDLFHNFLQRIRKIKIETKKISDELKDSFLNFFECCYYSIQYIRRVSSRMEKDWQGFFFNHFFTSILRWIFFLRSVTNFQLEFRILWILDVTILTTLLSKTFFSLLMHLLIAFMIEKDLIDEWWK